MKKKAEEIFGKNAETFLRFPEAMREDSDGKYAKVNGIECTIKCLFSDKKVQVKKSPTIITGLIQIFQDGIMPEPSIL